MLQKSYMKKTRFRNVEERQFYVTEKYYLLHSTISTTSGALKSFRFCFSLLMHSEASQKISNEGLYKKKNSDFAYYYIFALYKARLHSSLEDANQKISRLRNSSSFLKF